ncbi:hypothetical protein D3C81_2120550 [compost metagenome]
MFIEIDQGILQCLDNCPRGHCCACELVEIALVTLQCPVITQAAIGKLLQPVHLRVGKATTEPGAFLLLDHLATDQSPIRGDGDA